MSVCHQCQQQFLLEKDDLLPVNNCPDCFQRLLLSFRNERSLHKRQCDLCKKDFIGVYPKNSPYTVYCSKCWWSDQWDPYEYQAVYNPNKDFFEQFKELYKKIPHLGMNVTDSINSDYCNFADKLKDCYLVVNATEDENLYYCERAFKSKDCIDCNGITNCQLCYWCTSCRDCYQTKYSEFCESCTDCDYCYDCKGCQDCFGCFGLRNQKNCCFNKKCTPKEYQKNIYQFWQQYPHRYANIISCENVTGDNVTRSKNCHHIFDADEMENCKYCHVGIKSKEAQYCVPADAAEHSFNNMSVWEVYNVNCSHTCWYSSDIYYSYGCMSSQNLFGCAGLKKTEFCILNKKYSEEDYKKIKQQIIKQLQETNQYGNFFSISLNPFAYNETIAFDHYPLTKEQAIKLGYSWKEEENKAIDPILPSCNKCHKNYKIIKQEEVLYKKLEISLPQNCPNCRYHERFLRHNPRKLCSRICMNKKCGKKIMSSYAENRSEIIYCNECYNMEIY